MLGVAGAVGLPSRDKVREMLGCIFCEGEWLYHGVLGSISLLVLEDSICSWLLDDRGTGSTDCPYRFGG